MDPGFVSHLSDGSPLDRVELAMAFEKSFETKQSDEEIETKRGFRTAEEVVDYLLRREEGGR